MEDIDLVRWREFPDLITDSLWLMGAREKDDRTYSETYYGQFIPQVARQLISRFTNKGNLVIDLFAGSGTSGVVAKELGRHWIGVELSEETAKMAQTYLASRPNPYDVLSTVAIGDSSSWSVRALAAVEMVPINRTQADLVILHPPYFSIIPFHAGPSDLSSYECVEDFLGAFRHVAKNAIALLEEEKFLALVIGDCQYKAEWYPLGFECMNIFRSLGLKLKGICVKDMVGNERGKGKNANLWRYRALKHNMYVFKHEYVMVFQKPPIK